MDSIKVDGSFLDFVEFVRARYNAKIYILSDGFRLFIKKILKNHIEKIDKVYANNLYFINKNFKTLYRYSKANCKMGVCKCSILDSLKSSTNIYIGDGFSDFCASTHADFIFAKGKLLNFLKNSDVKHFTMFSSFKDIIYQLPFVLENLHEERRKSWHTCKSWHTYTY